MRGTKGITLISLVITVIILLILAVVAINLAVNSEGLFNKAGSAANKWNTAVAEEGQAINDMLDVMNSLEPKPMVTKWNVAAGDEVKIYVYCSEYDEDDNILPNTTDITIDWGDGTNQRYTSGNLQYIGNAGYATHTYTVANTNATVTITGKCNVIGTVNKGPLAPISSTNLIAIEDWGETETKWYNFSGCINLTSIASPGKNTFSKVTVFSGVFYYCTSLTSIPSDLFANCTNVTSFWNTFYNCTSLTGNAIQLWERVPNGESNGYEGTPDGEGCYFNCTNLTDYDSIPSYWKQNPPNEF